MNSQRARGVHDGSLIRQLRHVGIVAEISRHSLQLRSVADVVRLAARRIIDLLPVSDCIWLECMPDGGVRFAGADFTADSHHLETYPVPDGALRRAIDSGECQQSTQSTIPERMLLAGHADADIDFVLALPVLTAQGVWGILCVTAQQTITFGEEDLEFLRLVAETVAVIAELNQPAIANDRGTRGPLKTGICTADSEQGLVFRRDFLELIADLTGRFICIAGHELEEELRRALTAIGKLAEVDHIYLLQVSEGVSGLCCSHAWSRPGIPALTVQQGPELADRFSRLFELGAEKKVVSLAGVEDTPDEVSDIRQFPGRKRVRSMLFGPLRAEDQLLGALGMEMIREPRQWTRDMERMFGLTCRMLQTVLIHRRPEQDTEEHGRQHYRQLVESVIEAMQVDSRQVEKYLLDERSFTDSAINSLPGIFYICDQRGKLRRWNRRMELATGLPPAALENMRLQDLFRPDDRPLIWRRMEKLLDKGEVSLEAGLIARDGSVMPYLLTMMCNLSLGKRYLVGTGMDVTERHTAEKERIAYLRRTRMQHQTIGRVAVSQAVAEGDLDEVYDDVTKRLAEVLKVSRASIWLFDEKQQLLICVKSHSTGQRNTHPGQVLKIARFPNYFRALQEGVGIDAAHVEQDPRTRELFEEHVRPLKVKSLLDTPIRTSGQVIGVVSVEQVGVPRRWAVDEVSFVAAIANQVAQALINRERRLSAQALMESEQRYRVLYDDNPSMFFTVDAEGFIRSANRFAAETLGHPVEHLVGLPFDTLHEEEDQPCVDARIADCISAGGAIRRWDTRLVRAGAEPLWVRVTARSIEDADGVPVMLSVCEDITEARKLSEELSYQASHDSLTGLCNRREFEHRLELALQRSRQDQTEHVLLYMDLDQFKVINDTCGHIAGDELLRQLSDVLRSRISRRDTLARLGGDEFGVLLEQCSPDNAVRVAETARKAIAEFRFGWGGQTFGLGVSIGLVPITSGSTSINDIMSLADTACYAAKDQGRNRIHTYRADDFELARRHGEMQWVNRIRQALDESRFRLYYQRILPLSDIVSDSLRYELLLRMLDERGEIVSPSAFLPAAERYNLAPRMDRWVLLEALSWLSARPDHVNLLASCSINLSGHSMGDEDFLDFVLAEIRNARVPPEKLCFEITETAAIRNLSTATKFIKRLRDEGCYFALDDFGSGLSSFAYLKNLPVDYLKIDGMFVRDILEDPINLAVVTSINDIGHVMGKQTIAEFAESEAIMVKLRSIGIDYAQGYAIGAPASRDTLLHGH